MGACGRVLLLFLGCALAATTSGQRSNSHFALSISNFESNTSSVFAAWAAFNGKAYSAEDLQARLPIFTANVARQIRRLGLYNGFTEVNGLADISTEEFKATHLGHVSKSIVAELGADKRREEPYAYEHTTPPQAVDCRTEGIAGLITGQHIKGSAYGSLVLPTANGLVFAAAAGATKHHVEPYRYEHITPPKSVDWRTKGIVGPIKDQHVNGSACGCCWTFATTGVAECIIAMATGKVIALSEQQLIDCDRAGPWFDLGCDGGDFQGGIEYITENGGIDTEEDYPYLAADDKCMATALDGFAHVPPQNETALAQAVSQHPVAVAVCCGDYIDNWHQYTGGIFEISNTDIPGGCTDPLDHAVVIVGYGTTDEGQDYWLIKNSWSLRWGEQGFFRARRNVGAPLAAFELATQPGYPIKKGVNSKDDPIRTDIWDAELDAELATSDKTVAASR